MALKPKLCNRECGATIQMDNKDGRWLPYNMDGTVHKCNTIEDKDDHGNESVSGIKKGIEDFVDKSAAELKEYVDHTAAAAKGISKVKIFASENSNLVEIAYNEFLATNNGKIKTQGAQFQINHTIGFAIALYYEETK